MKPSANLQQAGDATTQGDAASCGWSNMRENFQQRALACSVPSNNPYDITTLNFEIHILQSPELVPLNLTSADKALKGGGQSARAGFAKVPVLLLTAQLVPLGKAFD